MEVGIKLSASRTLKKPERKVIEKNRRNKMKYLYAHLYSLVPSNFTSQGGQRVSDKVDRTIEYIKALKNNLDMIKKKKDKLLSNKRSHERTKVNSVRCKSLEIQIHEISHDLDVLSVTGLDSYSSFRDVVQLLGRYSTEVTLANFSSSGHSTFHIRQKNIQADDVCKRVKNLANGCSNGITELPLGDASFYNEVEPDLNIWDLDFQSSVWGCELEMILKG